MTVLGTKEVLSGGHLNQATRDVSSRHPPPGLANNVHQPLPWDVGVSKQGFSPNGANNITFGLSAIRLGPVDHFFGQSILVFTRSVAGTYAEQALDWVQSLNLGLIVSQVSREVELYNSHRGARLPDEPQTVDAISIVSGVGVTVVADRPLPTVLNEYQSMLTSVVIAQDGPPTLDAIITFELTPDADNVLMLLGTRVNIFGFCPQRDPEEIIEFGTEIFESRDGHEQRHAFRVSPIVNVKYEYKMEDPERLAMMNKIIGNGARLFTLPTWFENEQLMSDLSIGDSVIPVDTRFSDYRDDGSGLVILWRAWNDFETVPISSFTDSTITTKNPLGQAHAAINTLVMPAHPAFIDNRTRIGRQRRSVADFDIRFRMTDGTPRTRMLATPTPNTYQGLPIIEDPNYVRRSLREFIRQDFETLESGGGGSVDTFRPRIYPKIGSRKTWISDGREGRWNLRGLMHHLKGRRNAFYISTFAEDFIPISALTTSTALLEYSPNDYTAQIMDLDPRRDIEVRLKNGTIIRRRIIGSSDDSTTSGLLTLDAVWASTIQIDEIDRISFLIKVRLDTDNIVMKHLDSNETSLLAPIMEIIE